MSRWLVFSGGARYGAWQVGAYQRLAEQYHYDGYVGSSTGALAARLAASHFADYDAAAALRAIYESIDNDSIYRWRCPLGKLWAPLGYLPLIWADSVYDSSPLRKLISAHLTATQKACRVTATSYSTGNTQTFDNPTIDHVMASAAFPGLFSPVKIDNDFYIDGGIRENVPVRLAVEAGATHIDVLNVASHIPRQRTVKGQPKALEILTRTIELQRVEIVKDDLRVKFPECQIRVFEPDIVLDMGSSFDFDPHNSRILIRNGYYAADQRI